MIYVRWYKKPKGRQKTGWHVVRGLCGESIKTVCGCVATSDRRGFEVRMTHQPVSLFEWCGTCLNHQTPTTRIEL